MKRKINNHNTVIENNAIKLSEENSVKQLFLGEYFNIHTFKKHPITSNFILQEAMRLKQWAEVEDSLRVCDFYDQRGYSPEIFYQWVDKYPEMNIANNYALRRIGSRREGGALNRKFAETTVHKTLGRYDHVWREEMALANAARLAVAEKSESKVLIIERFPSSSGEYRDVEVISSSKFSPEEVASNIRRNTATDRQVKVNANVGETYE